MLCCAGSVVGLVLTACAADPVPISTPALSPGSEQACRAFLDALPDSLAEQDQDETEPADALGAAYGDPPIVVTCSDEAPADFDRFAAVTWSTTSAGSSPARWWPIPRPTPRCPR